MGLLSFVSRVWLCATFWTVAWQVPLFMGFSSQEYWSGSWFPSPGALPNPGIIPKSHVSCTGRQVLYNQCHLGSPERMDKQIKLYCIILFLSLEVFLVPANLEIPLWDQNSRSNISYFIKMAHTIGSHLSAV